MDKSTFIIMVLSLSLFLAPGTQVQLKAQSDVQKTNAPTIIVTKLDIGYKTLKLNYEIRNCSGQDVWICDSVFHGYNYEVYLDEDGQTLIVRKRLDVPSSIDWFIQPFGKYVRLRPGEKRIESLFLTVPVNSVYIYKSQTRKRLQSIVDAKRLAHVWHLRT